MPLYLGHEESIILLKSVQKYVQSSNPPTETSCNNLSPPLSRQVPQQQFFHVKYSNRHSRTIIDNYIIQRLIRASVILLPIVGLFRTICFAFKFHTASAFFCSSSFGYPDIRSKMSTASMIPENVWKRKLNAQDPPTSVHTFSRPPIFEALSLLPVAYRVGSYIYGERQNGREPIFDLSGIALEPPNPGPHAGVPCGGLVIINDVI